MTDHIVVFDGNPRLIGQTVNVTIHEASPFTLYAKVETSETVAVAQELPDKPACESDNPFPSDAERRIALPLV
jgi:tRNA-2-methylthio-N6-dimethylallyladenosine synthase